MANVRRKPLRKDPNLVMVAKMVKQFTDAIQSMSKEREAYWHSFQTNGLPEVRESGDAYEYKQELISKGFPVDASPAEQLRFIESSEVFKGMADF